jgi:hypothetical protein
MRKTAQKVMVGIKPETQVEAFLPQRSQRDTEVKRRQWDGEKGGQGETATSTAFYHRGN